MKRYIFLICLVILALSGTIALAYGTVWPLEPLTSKAEISEPGILLLIGSFILFIAGFSRKSYKH